MKYDPIVAGQQFQAVNFWDSIAELHDTFGLPYDILRVRLRQDGLIFDDERFLRLVAYMVGRRNKSVELVEWDEFVREYLILLPENFNSEMAGLLT